MDLIAELRAGQLDEAELAHLFAEVFPSAEVEGEQTTFGRPGEPWAARLVFGGRVLVRIDRGPGLKSSDVEELRRRVHGDLLPERQARIARGVLFTRYPVEGAVSVPGILQILPAPQAAPRPPFLLADHPAVIEFLFRPSPNVWVNGSRRTGTQRALAFFLNVVLEGGAWADLPSADHSWVLVPGEALTQVTAEYLQTGYFISGFVGEADEFSDISGFPPLMRVPGAEYFARYGIQAGRGLQLPDSFAELIRCYDSLSRTTKDSLFRSTFWYAHGARSRPYSISAHLTSLVSAIEALIPRGRPDTKCEKCGKSLGPSATQQFVEFLERYAPAGEGLERGRRELYSVRSRLSHGELLFHRDLEFGPVLGTTGVREYETGWRALQAARLAIVNWALSQCSQAGGTP